MVGEARGSPPRLASAPRFGQKTESGGVLRFCNVRGPGCRRQHTRERGPDSTISRASIKLARATSARGRRHPAYARGQRHRASRSLRSPTVGPALRGYRPTGGPGPPRGRSVAGARPRAPIFKILPARPGSAFRLVAGRIATPRSGSPEDRPEKSSRFFRETLDFPREPGVGCTHNRKRSARGSPGRPPEERGSRRCASTSGKVFPSTSTSAGSAIFKRAFLATTKPKRRASRRRPGWVSRA